MTQAIPIPSVTATATPQHASAAPLSADHHAQLAQAQQRRKKINRAQIVAAFNAWCFSIFAGFSLLFAIFSFTSLIAAVVLAGLAYNEFRGRRQLKQLDPRGPQTLGTNQLLCCAAIALYCGYQIVSTFTGPGPYEQAMQETPELVSTLEPIQELLYTAKIAAYALILIVGVAAQGATACYYFTRKKHLNAYVEQTPRWVIDLERTQAAT